MMDRKFLQEGILGLLKNSLIPDHDKRMIEILLPIMAVHNLQNTYNALRTEQDKLAEIQKREERISLKYTVMVENLVKAKGKTAKRS